MSDALTDIARDQRRSELLRDYLLVVIDYLSDQTEEKYSKVLALSEIVDSVVGGYWSSSPTKTANGLPEKLERLKANDEGTWAGLLAEFLFNEFYSGYLKAKKLSPFCGRALVYFNDRGQHLLDSSARTNTAFEGISSGDGYLIIGLAKNKFPNKKSDLDWRHAIIVAIQVDDQWQVERVLSPE